jgi:hypothetical protein
VPVPAWRLQLEQRGSRVVGTAYPIAGPAGALPGASEAPMSVEGTFTGDRLTLNFADRRAERSSTAHFVFYVTDEGSLRGRYRNEAAQATGSSVATRESRERQ